MRTRLTASRKIFFLLADAALFLVTAAAVNAFRFGVDYSAVLSAHSLWVTLFLLLSSLYVFGTYDLDDGLSPVRRALRTGTAVSVALTSILVLNYLLNLDRGGLFGRGVLLGSVAIFTLGASVFRAVVARMIRSRVQRQSLIVLCEEGREDALRAEFALSGWSGAVHFLSVSAHPDPRRALNEALAPGCDALLLGGDLRYFQKLMGETLMNARLSGLPVQSFSRFVEAHARRIPLGFVDSSWFIVSEGFLLQDSPFPQRVKRLFDVLLSLLLGLVTWPFMLLTALAVKLDSRGPALYRQVRLGKDGALFTIYKFRSMSTDAEKGGAQWAARNDARVTRVGKFIRKTRLDELPQLWNVLRGEMSFIGPRPERPEFNEQLTGAVPFFHLRNLVRPGVTGWAQVMYPYGASVEDARRKLEYDLYYIKNYSLWLDLKIVLRTVRIVLFAGGR